MKRLLAVAVAAMALGGCSSAAAPDADNVLKQVEKAEDVQEQVDQRNAELEAQP